ncbi:MAG: hypothetical protein ACRD3O_22245, partial [Terriglobia bacterium]
MKIVPVFPKGFEELTNNGEVGVQVEPTAGGQAPPVPTSNCVSVNETPPGSVRKFAKLTVEPGGVELLLMFVMLPVWPPRPANVPVLAVPSMVKLPWPELQEPVAQVKLSEVMVAVTFPVKASSPVIGSANTDSGTNTAKATVIKSKRLLIELILLLQDVNTFRKTS